MNKQEKSPIKEPDSSPNNEERIAKMIEEDIAKMNEDAKKETHVIAFEENLAYVRSVRNQKLQQTDWTQVPDVPTNIQEAWRTYRQELRDLPASFTKLEDLSWPEEPSQN